MNGKYYSEINKSYIMEFFSKDINEKFYLISLSKNKKFESNYKIFIFKKGLNIQSVLFIFLGNLD